MASRSRSHQRFPRPAVRPFGKTHTRSRFRPSLLVLEPRTLLSTFTVTNTNDSGSGSLRYEISQAKNGDMINFASSLFGGGQHETITLTSGPLNITTNVTIEGPEADWLTVDGDNKSTVMTIPAGADVTVADLTLAHGKATSGGGAIDNSGGAGREGLRRRGQHGRHRRRHPERTRRHALDDRFDHLGQHDKLG